MNRVTDAMKRAAVEEFWRNQDLDQALEAAFAVQPLPTPAPQDRVREAAQVVLKAYGVTGPATLALRDALDVPTEHPDLPGLRRALEEAEALDEYIPAYAVCGVIRAEIARLEGPAA